MKSLIIENIDAVVFWGILWLLILSLLVIWLLLKTRSPKKDIAESEDGIKKEPKKRSTAMPNIVKPTKQTKQKSTQTVNSQFSKTNNSKPKRGKDKYSKNKPKKPVIPKHVVVKHSPPPNEEGIFLGNKFYNKERQGRTLYIIMLDTKNDNVAYFELTSDTSVRDYFFSTIDKSIKPACELRGEGSLREAKHLDITPGTLMKEGDNWRVVNKSIINY